MRKLLLLAALGLIGTWGCAPVGPPPAEQRKLALRQKETTPKEKQPLSRLRAKLSGLQLTDPRGRPIWEGQAQDIVYDDENRTAVARSVKMVFSENGVAALEVEASEAQLQTEEKVARLRGGVRGLSRKGKSSFEADEIEWRWKKNRVFGRGNVYFRQGDSVARADSLEADTSLKVVSLRGRPVRVRLVLPPGKKLW
jgi:LPS export ABC transporter protein LptC